MDEEEKKHKASYSLSCLSVIEPAKQSHPATQHRDAHGVTFRHPMAALARLLQRTTEIDTEYFGLQR